LHEIGSLQSVVRVDGREVALSGREILCREERQGLSGITEWPKASNQALRHSVTDLTGTTILEGQSVPKSAYGK
jgi:hypothetical protein